MSDGGSRDPDTRDEGPRNTSMHDAADGADPRGTNVAGPADDAGGAQNNPPAEDAADDDRPTAEIPAHGSTHLIKVAARTDRGLIRSTNQDSVFAGDRLLVVADGMGGHAAGDTASRLVVDAFAPLDDTRPGPDLIAGLVDATADGNEAIATMVREHPDLEGMGTTVTAMYFDGARAAMVHVGDSRAYLYRAGVLHQLTHDDSFVQSLVDEGRITEDQAHAHPQRNLLLRALTGSDLEPSAAVREIREGDRYLLCSDGLSGVVDAEPIADALAHPDPDIAADTLVQLALLAGGPDNVTVIVADVVATSDSTRGPSSNGAPAADPDSTGPMPHLTRELPRVPLPPIPEEPGGQARLIRPGEADPDDERRGDDEDLAEDEFDDEYDEDFGAAPDAEPDPDPSVIADRSPRPDDTASDTATGPATARPATARSAATPGEASTADRPLSTADRIRLRRRRSRRRAWQKRLALALAILVLAGVGLTASTLWVRSQYFVGAQANLVGIFRGVNGSLFGLRFSSFEETSCGDNPACTPIKVSDLQPAARHQVKAGIQADSLADARDVMERLEEKLLPPCPDPDDTSPAAAFASPGSTCRVVG